MHICLGAGGSMGKRDLMRQGDRRPLTVWWQTRRPQPTARGCRHEQRESCCRRGRRDDMWSLYTSPLSSLMYALGLTGYLYVVEE